MNLESLLISRDASLLGILRPALEKLSVNFQICGESQAATDQLTKRKFDAVIIDCDDMQNGFDLLHALRQSGGNAKSVSFAVVNGKTTTQQAFQSGANFVLQKPLTPLHATRCFHAALNFMIRERRRYYRYPIEMPVHVSVAKAGEVKASSTNLSESGIALRVTSKLEKDMTVGLRFTLPTTNISLEL